MQEYLDEVGAFPAPSVLKYVGAASGPTARFALITNWKTNDLIETVPSPDPPIVHAGTNWQPSRFDQVQINGGTVAVDAVGQHAGVLRIAANSGNNATLNVTSGWLKVKDDIIIAGSGATAALNLSGGTLRTTTLSKGSGGSFSFTGGKLSADTVNFSLTNNGGTLAPGDSIGATETNSAAPNIGQTHVVGDLSLNSGTLQIELSSLASFDKLLVDGVATLGGNLAVSTLGGFVPANGNSWQIITAGGISLNFGSVTAGYTVQQQGNNLMLFFGNPTLAGDYNGDSIVNAGDYLDLAPGDGNRRHVAQRNSQCWCRGPGRLRRLACELWCNERLGQRDGSDFRRRAGTRDCDVNRMGWRGDFLVEKWSSRSKTVIAYFRNFFARIAAWLKCITN